MKSIIDGELLLAIVYTVPAIGYGIVLGLPVWLYWIVQKFFKRNAIEINLTSMALLSLFSFVIAVCIYTYEFIEMEYVFSLASAPSPVHEEKIKYQNESINEALKQSVIPPSLQRNCYDKPEAVCRLGKDYSLALWDTEFTLEDAPLLGGITSALTSILFVILGKKIFQEW